MTGQKVRVIDLETAGQASHEVCEIGWQDVVQGEDGRWSIGGERGAAFVHPGRPISVETMAVHHIVDADVEGAPFWKDAAPKVLRPEGGVLALAAHRASFEQHYCTPRLAAGAPWICTWKCALRLWPQLSSFSNQMLRYQRMPEGLVRELGLPAHRALPDAYVTAHHLRDMLNEASLEQLLAWSREPGLLPRVPAGAGAGQGLGAAGRGGAAGPGAGARPQRPVQRRDGAAAARNGDGVHACRAGAAGAALTAGGPLRRPYAAAQVRYRKLTGPRPIMRFWFRTACPNMERVDVQSGSVGGDPDEPSPQFPPSLGLSRASVIRVTGAGAFSALIWLCRHGFDDVGYVRLDAHGARERADFLLVTESCDGDTIARLLDDGPRLSPGGALAFRCRRALAASIRRQLLGRGFAVEIPDDRSPRPLCIAKLWTAAPSLQHAA